MSNLFMNGIMQFYLKKDTPDEILEQLLGLAYYSNESYDTRCKRIDTLKAKYPDSILLKNFHLGGKQLYISFVLKNVHLTDGIIKAIDHLYEKSEHSKTIKEIFESLTQQINAGMAISNDITYEEMLSFTKNNDWFDSYHFHFSYSEVENYCNDFDNIYEFCKPWFLYDTNEKIGHIEDLNNIYCKSYYYNAILFEKIMKERAEVCEGCSKYNLEYECPKYDSCQAAFFRGLTKGKKLFSK